jgi:hypothetical protein
VQGGIPGHNSKTVNDFNGAQAQSWQNPTTNGGKNKESRKEEEKKEEKSQQQRTPSTLSGRTPREVAAAAAALADRLLKIADGAMANPASAAGLLNHSPIMAWIEAGADPDLDIVPAVRFVAERTRARGMQRIGGWNYFNTAVAEAKQRREQGLPTVVPAQQPADAKREAEMRKLQGIVGRPLL